jgi:hypothetical protein
VKVTDSNEHSNFLLQAPASWYPAFGLEVSAKFDDQLDRESSTVVEHLPHYPYVKGLSPAATVDVGRNKWQSMLSISDDLLSIMQPQQSTPTKSMKKALHSSSGWTDMFPQNGLAKPRV